MFVQPPPQRVVGVVDAQLAVFKAYQAVKQVPVQAALLAVVPAADLAAAFVVVVVAAGVFAQQVVHEFVAFGVLLQRSLYLLGFLVQQVARRVVAVGQRPATAVVDVDQLACGIVFIVALEQHGLVKCKLVF